MQSIMALLLLLLHLFLSKKTLNVDYLWMEVRE